VQTQALIKAFHVAFLFAAGLTTLAGDRRHPDAAGEDLKLVAATIKTALTGRFYRF